MPSSFQWPQYGYHQVVIPANSISQPAMNTTPGTTYQKNYPVTIDFGSDHNIIAGAAYTITGTGIPANTTVVSAATVAGVWTVTLNNNATASGTYTFTFDNNISVSGGVVMLYPYLFVYGNYGLIQNWSAGNFITITGFLNSEL